jgi:hypothetical protein
MGKKISFGQFSCWLAAPLKEPVIKAFNTTASAQRQPAKQWDRQRRLLSVPFATDVFKHQARLPFGLLNNELLRDIFRRGTWRRATAILAAGKTRFVGGFG